MENSPSALLQVELASLAAEKMDLQRKLDQSLGTSKVTRQKLLKAYQVTIFNSFTLFVLYFINVLFVVGTRKT